jgi:hypothetical protein
MAVLALVTGATGTLGAIPARAQQQLPPIVHLFYDGHPVDTATLVLESALPAVCVIGLPTVLSFSRDKRGSIGPTYPDFGARGQCTSGARATWKVTIRRAGDKEVGHAEVVLFGKNFSSPGMPPAIGTLDCNAGPEVTCKTELVDRGDSWSNRGELHVSLKYP